MGLLEQNIPGDQNMFEQETVIFLFGHIAQLQKLIHVY